MPLAVDDQIGELDSLLVGPQPSLYRTKPDDIQDNDAVLRRSKADLPIHRHSSAGPSRDGTNSARPFEPAKEGAPILAIRFTFSGCGGATRLSAMAILCSALPPHLGDPRSQWGQYFGPTVGWRARVGIQSIIFQCAHREHSSGRQYRSNHRCELDRSSRATTMVRPGSSAKLAKAAVTTLHAASNNQRGLLWQPTSVDASPSAAMMQSPVARVGRFAHRLVFPMCLAPAWGLQRA